MGYIEDYEEGIRELNETTERKFHDKETGATLEPHYEHIADMMAESDKLEEVTVDGD